MTHSRKRIRKISTAVFRGSHTEYSFDVYPITTAITDNPAIFIFSRRSVDKFGRAHHAVSCVGETGSIVAEIKKHKRARCVKASEANVVCILKEPNTSARTGVLEDIAAARAFNCVGGTLKPTINSKSNAYKNTKTAKILMLKRAPRLNANDVAPCTSGTDSGSGKSIKQIRKKSIVRQASHSKASTVKTIKNGNASKSERQRRLSKSKRPTGRTTETSIAGSSRSRTKLAA